jgi:D-3-phosphoglycerate dehydrogenase
VATVLVVDPIPELEPYEPEREVVTATGAQFELGDGQVRDAEIILNTGVTTISAAALRQLARCRLIIRYGVGYDTIDLQEASRLGIAVANAPSYCVSEVADHACALILALARRIPWLDREVRAGRWSDALDATTRVRRLRTLTLGVVGMGRIGSAVARRMAAFELRVVGCDPQLSDDAIWTRGAEPLVLDELLRQSDIVTLHVPLTPATRYLLGTRELALLRPTSALVNTARGGLLDEQALITALAADRLFGAALDVLEREPPDLSNPLLQFDPQRVILTPHVGAASAEARLALHREVAAAVATFLAGRLPESVVNRDALYNRRSAP